MLCKTCKHHVCEIEMKNPFIYYFCKGSNLIKGIYNTESLHFEWEHPKVHMCKNYETIE
jgi:hypothetical protein